MLDLLNNKEIYDKVDRLRLKKGWTIYELAKKAGISVQTLYNWRNRLSSPSLSLLDAVCFAFNITVIDFLLDEDELLTLTEEQKELMRLWNTLSSEQKKSILSLMKSM
ncbi:MAG: helix-turn-helix domain-containing protein [Clostridia bacterium]|nr:helix-turn-helix domain-containing protein [Clostridia bacterium]MDE7337574.1 helix-turn-helix domain-containing protein [Clostridia bacterium]